ncbi:MAG: hypothetical protein KF773_30605 [Deltaproteobacteria bacterium]|nr:hypothetical protein [Deltaproteobacteria bacterium]
MAISRAVLLGALVACGSSHTPPTAPPPTAPPAATKDFAPLGIKADAKLPHQAVILGTDEKNGSTILRLPAAQSKGLVDAMVVKTSTSKGSQTPVRLATAPNSDGSVQVGIFEEMAGGTGPQWRAGVWVSAFVAANSLGKDLTDFQFTASSTGYIDGASASGLMAGGFLATMTGQKIDPAVTMTGIINPDGTIGPVGGIPEKFAAAIAAGKKRVGFPIGMRFAKSEATGKLVDVVQLAKDKGAEAVEVANVHEAYLLLTGVPLPQPVPVADADMALDPDTVAALDGKYKEWQRKVGDEWARLLELQQAGRLPPLLAMMTAYARAMGERAEKLHAQKQIAAAYAKMLQAWVFASAATDTFAVLTRVQAGDTIAAIGALGALDTLEEASVDVFRKIGAIRPRTLGDHLLMLGAFQAALRGWGFRAFASDAVAGTKKYLQELAGPRGMSRTQLGAPAVADAVVAKVAPTVVLLGRAVAETTLAAQRLEFEREKSINYTCSIPNVRRMATSYQSAAVAGVNYFDTLLVQGFADANKVPLEDARRQVMMAMPEYLVAFVLSHVAQADGLPAQLKQQWGEKSVGWNLLALAASEQAYFDAATLVAKHYSLGVQNDASGRASSLAQDKAFTNMLASAERAARASARAARIATGAIPVQARLAYQLANVQREGDLADKLDALQGYWTSSAYSQTAVMLARN